MQLEQRPVSRTALIWLLILQLGVLFPVALQLPAWLLLISGLCWGWRLAIFRGALSSPGRWAKAGLVFLCIGLVIWLEGNLYSLRGFALLLALGFVFKLVELRNLKDAYTVLFVALLLLVANLLLSQSLVTSLLTALGLFALLGAWVGLNQVGAELKWRQSLKWASLLYLLALPLTLVMFVLVPRIPPIWQIATDSGQAQVGISESMSPGDISQLARSDALAFRVNFEGERPRQEELYWRTVVMTGFDGRRWWQESGYWFNRRDFEIQGWAKPLWQGNSTWISWPEEPKPWSIAESLVQPYQVIMEPSQQHWLPALESPRSRSANVGLMADQRLIYRFPIQQRFQYQVFSGQNTLALDIERELLERHEPHYLLFPEQRNPRMQAWAKELWRQYSSVEAFVRAFNRHTFSEQYVYTLEPPLLGEDAVDEFWFETQQGFCAHYASALAFALRVVGIPSRVIGGYHGGEWDSDAAFLQVRQFDAHAWVEYWDDTQGWMRSDPTAAIAPHRIRQSFAESLRLEQTAGADKIVSWRLSTSGWLTQLRTQWDQLEYLWHKRVLNYKAEQQYELLKSWFGQVNWSYLMIGLMLAVSAFLSLITLWQSKPWLRAKQPPEVILLNELRKRLEKFDIKLERHLPLSQLDGKLGALNSEQQELVVTFVRFFEQACYEAPGPNQKRQWQQLKALVRKL